MNSEEFCLLLSGDEADRWRLIREFVASWHRPLVQGDGCDDEEVEAAERRLGFRLPRALADWYRLAGRRGDLVDRQDHLVPPARLDLSGGFLVVHRENQGCFAWAVRAEDLRLPDPPVFLLDGDRPDRPLAEPWLTAFVAHMLVQETVATGPGPKIWTDRLGVASYGALRRRFDALGLLPWSWGTNLRVVLASPDLDVLVDLIGEGDLAQAVVAARDEATLARFVGEFPAEWAVFG